MKGKKKLFNSSVKGRGGLFFCLFLLCALPLWSEPFSVSFFSAQKPAFSFLQRFEYEFMHDTKNDRFGISSVVCVDSNELLAMVGVNATSKSTDVALETYYAPCLQDFLSFGVNLKYHYCKYADVFAEHNVAGGLFVRVNLYDVWNLYLNGGTFGKFTIINAWPYNIRIKDKSLYFKTGVIFTPGQNWTFLFDVSNISLFEDNIVGVFMFDVGANRMILQNISLGADIFFKWEDASVPADSFNQIAFRINLGIYF